MTKDRDSILNQYLKEFQIYLKSEEHKNDLRDREGRIGFYRTALSRERLKTLNEFDFGELISKLWASGIWGNKEYLVSKIISENGIILLREELSNLLYGSQPFEQRYDSFRKKIKGLGPSSITEILCYFNPSEYGIWNGKARAALKVMGYEDELHVNKYQIDGKQYLEFNIIAKGIAQFLLDGGVKGADLLVVDYFLWMVWNESDRDVDKSKNNGQTLKEFDHDEIRDFVKDIGLWLGFESEVEVVVGQGAKVDAIWRARIANLGVVTYVFEVHRNGSMDSLILNLQKALRNPTVQKVIAVSDVVQLEKIKGEIRGLSDDFARSLSFWDVNEVKETHEKLSTVIQNVAKLDLVKSGFGDPRK